MLSFFPRGVLDEILNLIESVSEGFPSNSFPYQYIARRIRTLFLRIIPVLYPSLTHIVLKREAHPQHIFDISEINYNVLFLISEVLYHDLVGRHHDLVDCGRL